MTREELIAAVERKRLIAAVEAKRAGANTPEKKYEATFGDRADAVLGQGLLLGGGDEIMSGMESAFSDVTYDEAQARRAAERKQYENEYPVESLALNVAGGLATGGIGGARVLGVKALQNADKIKKALALSGVGAIEGGVAGGLSANAGNRAEGAATGATIGAVLPQAVSALGAGGKKILQRNDKIAEMTQPDGSHLPLTLAAADDSVAGGFYRQIVQPAWGSGDLRKQAQPFIDSAEDAVGVAKQARQTTATAGKKALRDSESSIRQTADTNIGRLDSDFRVEALRAVTPAKLPNASRSLLDPENPQRVVDQLGQFWTDNGFKSAKSKTFDLDIGDFEKSLKGMFDDDPNLKTAAGDYLPSILGDFDKAFKRPPKERPRIGVATVTPPQTTKGTMRGDELMELRNKYARAANATSDDNKREAFRRVASRVDNMITDRLDGKDLSDYKDDMARWEAFSTYGKATGSAANTKGGKLTSDEWLAQTKNSKLKSERGVLQTSAQANQAAKNTVKKDITEQVKNNPVKGTNEQANIAARNAVEEAGTTARDLAAKGGKDSNLLHKTLATGILASPAALLAGATNGVSLLAGVGTAKALSTPSVQRAVAGQTGWQKKGREVVDRLNTPNYGMALSDALRLAPSAAVTTQLNDEQEQR